MGISAAYTIVKVQDDMVWITDDCLLGRLSVTNDAEVVCKTIHESHGNKRIIYRDSEGEWDELAHDEGRFTHYRAASQHALP